MVMWQKANINRQYFQKSPVAGKVAGRSYTYTDN